MLDFVLGIALAALIVRGWLRGFVREILDLVSLVAGIWVAFALSPVLGDFLSDQFGVRSEIARIGSGILLFVLFSVAMSIGAHFLAKVLQLPGLNLINRIGGAGVAAFWGVALILVVVNLANVLPATESWTDEFEESTVVQAIAGPGALPQKAFLSLGSEGILESLSSIQSLFGAGRVVPSGEEVLTIPPAKADELRQVREDVEVVVDRVNNLRVAESLGPLLVVEPLVGIAESRAIDMYTAGRISRETPIGGSVTDDLVGAGVRLEVDGEGIALAATSRAAIDALVDDSEALSLLVMPQFDRMGVALVEGPTGVLLIVVFGG